MKVLFLDTCGSWLDLALRAKRAGHEVRWFRGKSKEGETSPIGRGLVEVVSQWEGSMRWADVILLSDNVKHLHLLERYHREGYPIVGPTKAAAAWELDRSKGQEMFALTEATPLESHPFTSIGKAREWVLANPGRWVSKPNGDGEKALSYVSKGRRDLLEMFDRWESGDFILQRFAPGVEVAVGGWFSRSGFDSHFLENFEHKKLCAGDLGVNTGEMGTVLRYTEDSKLADMLLRPVEGELHRIDYCGYVDAAVIMGKGGKLHPLEWTMRPGWPLQHILTPLHQGDPIAWLADLAEGHSRLQVSDAIAGGVVITIPQFPYGSLHTHELLGYPVYETVGEKHFHPGEVMRGERWTEDGGKEEGLVTAGDYVCVVTGTGDTVSEAMALTYKNVGKVEIPNSPSYRIDIGERLKTDLPLLQEHGYCKAWDY